MNSPDHKPFFLDDWKVLPQEGVLSRGDELVHLEPKVMEVLVYLAQRPGEVITRESLEQDVWRGALVGYDAVTNTVIKLRKALRDDAKKPRYIATIPKKGYQIIAEVTYDGDSANQQSTTQVAQSTPTARRSIPYIWPVAIVCLAIVFLIFGYPGEAENQDDIPSIIVLPFSSLSNEPAQESLADGITEDIITDLSRISNIRVLASNTSFRYKGKQVTPEQVGSELDVGYVLTGSIRSLGGELRVNVQLVKTETGFNVWAQRYDRKVIEVFAVQDEVTQNIVQTLAVRLTNKEKQRLAHQATDSLQAYNYFLEGQRLYKVSSRAASLQAIEMYQKAIELDPKYGRAYGAQAVVLAVAYRRGWGDSPAADLDRALLLAKKAVEVDSTTPHTYWALGFVYLAFHEYELAEQAAKRTTEIAPNYADGYGLEALINSFRGRPERAVELNDMAIRLNPLYTHEFLITYGLAYYTMGNYEKAIDVLERALDRNPNRVIIKLLLSACYEGNGQHSEAEWMITEIKSINPEERLSRLSITIPLEKPEIRKKLLSDLRAAGLPE